MVQKSCQLERSLTGSYRFDSSRDRGDFKTAIGVGRVIQGAQVSSNLSKRTNPDNSSLLGWDEGVMEMTLGEKSVLTIPG